MAQAFPEPPAVPSILDRAEEWIYRLNERDHWLFKLYDVGNELWARMFFRATRAGAEHIDEEISPGNPGGVVRVRFLRPDDVEAFATFCAALDTRYLPPHPLDRAAAAAALSRRSYIPFGIFAGEQLVGYLLVRLFFFRRAVAGVWLLPGSHGRTYGENGFWVTTKYLRALGLPGYCTVPLDNTASIRGAIGCGFEIIRTNRRFHVLKLDSARFEARRTARLQAEPDHRATSDRDA